MGRSYPVPSDDDWTCGAGGTGVANLTRSLVRGLVVNAVLTEPLVTDYVPVARPPWALLLFAVCLLGFVVPRGVVWEFLIGAALAVVIGVVVNWVSVRRARGKADDPA